jgi:translocation and assembly module TamB
VRPPRRRWVAVFGLTVTSLVIGLWSLLATEPGLSLTWRVVSSVLPTSVALEGLEGRLVGPLEVRGLTYTSDRIRVVVQHATIDWDLGALPGRVLDVRDLDARGVALEIRDGEPSRDRGVTAGPSSFALPVEVRVAGARVREITLDGLSEGLPQVVDSLVLVDGAYRSEANLRTIDVWGPDGSLRLSGRLRTEDRYPFRFEVAGTLRVPGLEEAVELESEASGDLDDARLELVVRRPLALAMAAELHDALGARIVDAEVSIEETDFRAVSRDAPEGRGRAVISAAGPFDTLRITGSGQASTPETGVVDFEVELERYSDRLDVSRLSALLGSTGVEASGTIRPGPDEPTFDGRVEWRDARWPLRPPVRVRSGVGSATVTGSARLYSAELAADVAIEGEPGVEGAVRLAGTGTPESMEIDRLEIDALEGSLGLDGRLSWRPEVRWDLALRGDEIQPEMLFADTARYEGRFLVRGSTAGAIASDRIGGSLTLDTLAGTVRGDSVRGSAIANVTGTVESYRARVDAELVSADAPELGGALAFAGAGTPRSLEVDSLEVAALNGALRVRGRIAWSPEVTWDAGIEVDDLQLGLILPDTALRDTRLDVRGGTGGVYAADRLSAAVTVDTLRGRIRGEGVDGSMVAALDLPFGPEGPHVEEIRAELDRMALTWQESRLEASGVIEDTVALSLSLSVPDLSLVSPEVRGRAEVDFRARGPREEPRTELTATALSVALDSAAGTPPLIDSVTVALQGTPQSHQAEIRAGRAGGILDAGFEGAYADRAWSGEVLRFEFSEPEIGGWRLVERVELSASEDSVGVEGFCILQEPSRACASVLWRRTGTSSAEIVLEELTGRRLVELLPLGWTIDGRLGARAVGTLEPDGALRADGNVDLGSGTIELGRGAGARSLRYTDLSLEGVVDEAGARVSLATELFDESGAPAASADVEVTLPEYRNVRDSISAQPLRGFVRAAVPDIAVFRYALPDLEPVGGRLEADLALAGVVAEAEVEGEVRVEEGAVDLPQAGLQLRDIEVLARGRGEDGIELDASVSSGTGTLSVEGRAPVGPTEAEPARIQVSGTRVQALNLPDATLWLSPDLELAAWPEGLRLTGQVTVPVARIELTDIPATALRASDDVIFVDDTASLRLGRALRYSVRLVLGDSITFRGLGFSAEPEGSLALSDGAGGTLVVSGDIVLEEGRYQAYGQELTMERGRLLFAGGPPDNPGLDIRASRTASDGTVAGLEVRGTLEDPEVTIFSEPAMMESQALAYIVLGRPMSSGSESDGSRVTGAAVALGLQRGNQIATRLGRSLGLDEMTVEAGGTLDEASLVAGTYLSPQLYVSYGVGLFEPVSVFRIRYMLSRRWTVRAETGRANSADLLFRIERGR